MKTTAKPWEYRAPKKWEFFSRFIIGTPGDEYLDRLRIAVTPWFQVMLHRIYRPDRQRDLHDHPWSFFSVVLWGSYIENTPTGLKKCRWWNWKRTTDRHSIRECSRRPVWTLVFTGPKRRTWGFWVDEGTRFVPWREYEKLYGA